MPIRWLREFVIPASVVAGLTAMSVPVDPSAEVPREDPNRPADQTFLTYPEWYLVHSPDEYATFIADNPPSDYPFMGNVVQFWQSYGAVYDHIEDKYPFNPGYHAMVLVIGTSTTVEYAVRTGYEGSVGSLAAWTSDGMTAEDIYAAQAARRYVDFIEHTPFYEYDFAGDLSGLWTETPFDGGSYLRKIERRFALTSEYGIKAGYAWFIGKLTAGSYATPLITTTVHLSGKVQARPDLPKLVVVEHKATGGTVVMLPRYREFTHYATSLAHDGVTFEEIAGNTGEILTTVLVPRSWVLPEGPYHQLFVQDVETQPEVQRVAIIAVVGDLAELLRVIEHGKVGRVEHIYDY